MEREEAIEIINELIGQDLLQLAVKYGVTILTSKGTNNKGWAGHTVDKYLGLSINSLKYPDFGSWELKVIPLELDKRNQILKVKETMAITMINPQDVIKHEFEQSHLFYKLNKTLIVARVSETKSDNRSILNCVTTFDLQDPVIYAQVKADYELIRQTIINEGFDKLTGKMGVYIQQLKAKIVFLKRCFSQKNS